MYLNIIHLSDLYSLKISFKSYYIEETPSKMGMYIEKWFKKIKIPNSQKKDWNYKFKIEI